MWGLVEKEAKKALSATEDDTSVPKQETEVRPIEGNASR